MSLKLLGEMNFFHLTMIFSESFNLCLFFILGLRLVQSIPSTNAHKYFSIKIRNKNMFLHKATAAWYMQDRQTHMPADRLQRVQFRKT